MLNHYVWLSYHREEKEDLKLFSVSLKIHDFEHFLIFRECFFWNTFKF
jgi:hypothetical protein